MSGKRILVFQHLAVEHPGIFREFLRQDAIEWFVVELDQGDDIPDLNEYDGLWVMGGPMDVWQEREYPWLIDEKAAIRQAILELDMPFLGICLGHQLLADALGGEVAPGQQPEVGDSYVQLTKDGNLSPFYSGLSDPLLCLQWHSAAVTRAPAQAKVLATSQACKIQSLSVGKTVFTVQFHVEITTDTIAEWNAIPEYRESLYKSLGANGAKDLQQRVKQQMPLLSENAKRIYDNWKNSVLFTD